MDYYKFIFNEIETDNNIISLIRKVQYNSGMWEDPESDSLKKYIILYCSPNAFVRPYRAINGDLTKEQLKTFPIITGLEYRSTNKDEYLIYMEV
jgi:hypothetical protein